MKAKLIILFVILIGATIFLAGCGSDKKDEVNIFPIENPTGISWCTYEITKMNSADSTARLQTGQIICIKCPDENKRCPVYKRFKYGAYDMDVKNKSDYCVDCPNQNHFDVGGPI